MPQGGATRGVGGAMGARGKKSKSPDTKAIAKQAEDAKRQPTEHQLALKARDAATQKRRQERLESEKVIMKTILRQHEKIENKLRRATKGALKRSDVPASALKVGDKMPLGHIRFKQMTSNQHGEKVRLLMKTPEKRLAPIRNEMVFDNFDDNEDNEDDDDVWDKLWKELCLPSGQHEEVNGKEEQEREWEDVEE